MTLHWSLLLGSLGSAGGKTLPRWAADPMKAVLVLVVGTLTRHAGTSALGRTRWLVGGGLEMEMAWGR